MYFYVFLQPEAFSESNQDGEDASQNLAAILAGFSQNCLLAVFEDDRWDTAVKEALERWPASMTRRRVTALLVQLKKHNRFIYGIVPDYAGTKRDLDCVIDQAVSIPLDLMLVIGAESGRVVPENIEITTRRSYQNTAFEPKRSALATNGKTCAAGEMNELDFMNFHFLKALKHASSIDVFDRYCGKQGFSDNFHYTVKKFMGWLASIQGDSTLPRISFHFAQPPGKGADYMLEELASFRGGRLETASIQVNLYDDSAEGPALPHQRFIFTDQIALNVDRGFDFLDSGTKRCRDTYINYQDPNDAQNLLGGCTQKRVLSSSI